MLDHQAARCWTKRLLSDRQSVTDGRRRRSRALSRLLYRGRSLTGTDDTYTRSTQPPPTHSSTTFGYSALAHSHQVLHGGCNSLQSADDYLLTSLMLGGLAAGAACLTSFVLSLVANLQRTARIWLLHREGGPNA